MEECGVSSQDIERIVWGRWSNTIQNHYGTKYPQNLELTEKYQI